MSQKAFHNKPYDPGTLTKLDIFELYIQEWLPVFLSPSKPKFEELHVFDFFSGPGRDAVGVDGSPIRILNQFRAYREMELASWDKINKSVHLFDSNEKKIAILCELIRDEQLSVQGVIEDIEVLEFSAAMDRYDSFLRNPRSAKLLIIDQFGVDAVSDEMFDKLISYPHADFIFFLSSSTLHRFRSHPAIKQKIPEIEDSYHVHRAAFEYYKRLVPTVNDVFLGQFSIRKGSNIYGLIFGSQHPLGIHKFLQVAWKHDRISGEANFDVDRENVQENEILLDFDELKPKKIQAFESKLENALRCKSLHNEAEIMRLCIESGMTCKHAASTISKLRKKGDIDCSFRVPNANNWKTPRPIFYP